MKNQDLIHHEKTVSVSEYFLIGFILFWLIGVTVQAWDTWAPPTAWGIFLVISYVASSFARPYKVYSSRIDLLYPFSEKVKKQIFFEELESIRYEDGFNHNRTSTNYIMYYTKQGEYKIKGFKLPVRGYFREDDVFKLLKFYQSKNLKIFIKTWNKKWLKELDLKNWDMS